MRRTVGYSLLYSRRTKDMLEELKLRPI